MEKKVRIAINGFGRIGKMAFKVAYENHQDEVEIVAINDPNSAKVAAQNLQYDSVYRRFPFAVGYGEDYITVEGKRFPKLSELEPSKIPWQDLKVDVVLECTGVFCTKEKASQHLKAGAKMVIISAPAKGDDAIPTYVMGVNHDQHKIGEEQVISNASCTTNCIAPIMQILAKEFGLEKAMMTTIHAYTADQNLVDGRHKDPRRARSAAINIVPTSTGAAKATGETVAEVKGIFDGLAFRVPVPVGSVSDITALLKRNVTVAEINVVLEKAAQSDRYQGILEVTKDPIVSTDVVGLKASSLVDLSLTNVVAGNLVKVVAWYDNEYGYSHRLVEQAIVVGKNL